MRQRLWSAIALATLTCAGPASGIDAGTVVRVNGHPTCVRAGVVRPLKRGDAVAIGDRITTDAESKIKLLLADDSVLAIGAGSTVTLDDLTLGANGRTGRLGVLVGRFKLAIAAWLSGPSDYEVRTPTAVAGVRGTVLWGDTALDAICALQGTVEVRTIRGDARATLDAGHCVTKMAAGETVPLAPTADQLRRYLDEVTVR
jgi:hypothetical protein